MPWSRSIEYALVSRLEQTAEACEAAAADYARDETPSGEHAAGRLVLAAAAARTAAEQVDADRPGADTTLLIAATLARDAAAAARAAGRDDDEVERLVTLCDAAARCCERALEGRRRSA